MNTACRIYALLVPLLTTSLSAYGQASLSLKNALEGQGLTGYSVRAVPDGFEASEREWLQLLAGDPAVQQAMRDAVVDSIKDRARTRASFDRTIAWQNWLGRVVFGVVHIPLVLGLYFSWREFRAAERSRTRARQQSHEVEIGLEKVALKSSLQGMALFGVAVAFYLGFLTLVYPIAVL